MIFVTNGVPYVPRLAHAIIDDLCTRKEKREESLVRDAILLRKGVERPKISVGRVAEYCPTHYNNARARSKGGFFVSSATLLSYWGG